MKIVTSTILAVSLIGPAAAETYSTINQFNLVRNHATHEAAENIILEGKIISASVERGTHSFAVAFEDHLFNCVTPWDSYSHCRSETSEPLFKVKN
ncbi:MAG: hypothetical protein HKN18_14510 [Silicimonas sp.]|nr:hypothetical protein [Silicimonas sp.]